VPGRRAHDEMMRPMCRHLRRASRPSVALAFPATSRSRLQSSSSQTVADAHLHDREGQRRVWRWGCGVSSLPERVQNFEGVTAAACGSNHSAFVSDGLLHTFGSNTDQQLGRATTESTDPAPGLVDVRDGDGRRLRVVSVALGGRHAAAVTQGGLLWTWGWAGSLWQGAGAVGLGTRGSFGTPQVVAQLAEQGEAVRHVACGDMHTLVLTASGRVFSTGRGQFGRLGRGSISDELEFEELDYFRNYWGSILSPGKVDIVRVDAGHSFSACMSAAGELWVWGKNDCGQLGLGSGEMQHRDAHAKYPVLVRSLAMEGQRIVDFACGENHVIALSSSGVIYEWGNQQFLEPTPVTLQSRYSSSVGEMRRVVAGKGFSCAVTNEGQLYTWGSKSSGCLVTETVSDYVSLPTPVSPEVFGHRKVLDVAACGSRCLAVTE